MSDSPSSALQTTPRRIAASTLLAKFNPGANINHKKDSQKSPETSPQRSQMSTSSTESSSPSDQSVYETPPSNKIVDLVKDDEDDLIVYSAKPQRRLRERKQNMSLKALENGDIYSNGSRSKKKLENLIGADELSFSPVISKRVAIRQEIANKTAANRDRFFVEKKEFLLPLLPRNNYVRKLVEKHGRLKPEELAKLPSAIPYEEISTQPRGVKATMKPYQLSGLSFMVYLHRNVCYMPFDNNQMLIND